MRLLPSSAIILFSLFWSDMVWSQFDHTLFQMSAVPQSGLWNPATRNAMKWSVGLAQAETSAYSTGFTAFQAIARGSDVNENLSNILSNINERDFIRLNTQINVLYSSLDINDKWQLSGGLQSNAFAYLDVPVQLLRLLRGNNQEAFLNQTVNVGGFGFELMQLATYHLGASYSLNEKWNIGLRLKRHRAMFNYYLDRNENDLWVFFGDEIWSLESNSTLRSSLAFDNMNDLYQNGLSLSANKGFSLDLGVTYRYSTQLDFSLSAVQLGMVALNHQLRSWQSNGAFTYEGINVEVGEGFGGFSGPELIDSLIQAFDFMETPGNTYRRPLPMHFLFGTSYTLSNKHQFQVMFQLSYWLQVPDANGGLRYIWTPYPLWQVFGATYMGRNWTPGLGLGSSLTLPYFQLFLSADYMQPHIQLSKVNGVSVNLGLNIALKR